MAECVSYSLYSTVMKAQRDEQHKPCLLKLFTDRQCPLLFVNMNEAIAEHSDAIRVHDDGMFNMEEVHEVVGSFEIMLCRNDMGSNCP